MTNFKAAEFEYTGPRALSAEYLREMHRVAVNSAMHETYRVGQTIRIPDEYIDDLFWEELRANVSQTVQTAPRKKASKKTTKRTAKKASKKTTKRTAKKASARSRGK